MQGYELSTWVKYLVSTDVCMVLEQRYDADFVSACTSGVIVEGFLNHEGASPCSSTDRSQIEPQHL